MTRSDTREHRNTLGANSEKSRVRLVGVDHAYGITRVLTGVDFELTGGVVTGLIGQNGAGKSTLLKVLTGSERPLAGRIQDGAEVLHFGAPKDALRRGIAIVPQELQLFPHLTVAENIYGLADAGHRTRFLRLVDRSAMRADAAEVLAELGLDVDPRAKVDTLDQGQQTLVGIARAVARRPRFLILDEPTASLGPRSSANVLALIRRMAGLGLGVCFVTHRLHEVESVANEVVVMRDGRVVAVMREGFVETEMVAGMLGDHPELSGSDSHRDSRRLADNEVTLVARARVRPWVNETVVEARRGELVGLYGLLGSGAKRFVRLVGGLEPEGAYVTVGDRPEVRVRSTRAAVDAGISLIPEDRERLGIVRAMSVERNLCLSRLDRISRFGVVRQSEMRRHYREYEQKLSIHAKAPDVPVGNLSGGNAQKVLIGRAFFAEAAVVAIEEPTRGVDVGARAQIHQLLRAYVDQGGTAVVASTDSAELADIADRIVAFRDGVVVEEINPADAGDVRAEMSRAIGGD